MSKGNKPRWHRWKRAVHQGWGGDGCHYCFRRLGLGRYPYDRNKLKRLEK